jgi:hypothetical protein
MKYNKIVYTVLIAGLLGAGGCSKEKFSINSNPDDVTEASVTPNLILPAAQQQTAQHIAADYWWLSWWMGHGARSGSYQSLNNEETYKFTQSFHNELWNNLYANANNYHIMATKAQTLGAGTYEAIGRIMRSMNFQMLVDIYNNIPYSEALQQTLIPTPKYDKGEDVYKGIFDDLDAAIALLQDPVATDIAKNADIDKVDFVFAGNTTRWIQFANTLRLRMLVHLHNGGLYGPQQVVPGFDIAAQVQKIVDNGAGFLNAGQDAHFQPGFSAAKPQPYYRFYHTNEAGTGSQRDHLRASEYAIDYYKYDGDPRIDRFYVSPNGQTTGQKGVPFGTPSGPGVPQGNELSTVRGPGYIPQGAASRAWILTSFESLFIQAEARERGIINFGPSAEDLLRDAVRQSFIWLGLTSGAADTYMSNNAGYPDVDYNAPSIVAGQPGGGLFTILQQKWFAMNNINELEIWTDWRRTDIIYGLPGTFDPGPPLSVDPGAASVIPKRLLYPTAEYNYNAANVAAEGTIDYFTNRIFWDLN